MSEASVTATRAGTPYFESSTRRPGARAPDDHLGLEVVMVPDDVNAGVGVLASGRDALDNRMALGASDVVPRPSV